MLECVINTLDKKANKIKMKRNIPTLAENVAVWCLTGNRGSSRNAAT